MFRVIHRQGLKYGTRRMMAGDEFEIPDKRSRQQRILTKIGKIEPVLEPTPEPKRRGQPPKMPYEPVVVQPAGQAEAATGVAAMTVTELRSLAQERGHELPAHYLRKDELLEILGEESAEP